MTTEQNEDIIMRLTEAAIELLRADEMLNQAIRDAQDVLGTKGVANANELLTAIYTRIGRVTVSRRVRALEADDQGE